MNEEVVNRDLEKLRSRALHTGAWTEEAIRRYHALGRVDPGAMGALRPLYIWLLVR